MAGRPPRYNVSARTASSDSQYWGRYWNGDRPILYSALRSTAGQSNALTTGIRLNSSLASRYGLASDLSIGAGLTYEFQGLVSGIDADFFNDGHTTWTSDVTGSFARIDWPSTGGVGGLTYTLVDRTKRAVWVEYEMRLSTLSKNSKQLKIFGQGYPTAYSNCTWGTYYDGGDFMINYGDSATGSNDTTVSYYYAPFPYNGATLPNIGTGGSSFTRTPYPTQNYMPGSITIPDTGWHKYGHWQKFNADGTPDGEFAMFLDDILVFHVSGLYNCAAGQSLRDFVSFGNYTQGTQIAFTQDFRRVKIGYSSPSISP